MPFATHIDLPSPVSLKTSVQASPRKCLPTTFTSAQSPTIPPVSSALTDILQNHAAAAIAACCTKHPHYSTLAGRMFVAFLHKITKKTFSAWVAETAAGTAPFRRVDETLTVDAGPENPFHPTFVDLVARLAPGLDDAILHSRDFHFS